MFTVGPAVAALAAALAVAMPARQEEPPRGGRPARTELRIGLTPEQNLFKQRARFAPLGEYLSRRVGVPVKFALLSRYGDVLEGFEREGLDGAFFGSFIGAIAVERLRAIPLARPVNLDGTSTYRGYLFVRKDSGISGVAGMKGKRMAFVDAATTAGYVFPLAFLRAHGVRSAEGFFSESWFTGSHDAAIAAVLDGKADVGAAKHSVYEKVRREDPRVERELEILAESPPVPENGLCVRRGLEPGIREALRRALLGLESDPEGKAVLEKLGALRFVEAAAEDYAPVVAFARQGGIDLETYRASSDEGRAATR